MDVVESRAFARVGLLGNPSDIFGGRGLGFTFTDLGVQVRLTEAAANELPNELLWAACKLFAEEEGVDVQARTFALAIESTIPFQSGLAGSSAILVAALRAWAEWFDRPLTSARIAELALRTEVERLGIVAGAMDRLVQAGPGLVYMDFARPFESGATQQLDPKLMPSCIVAWDPEPGTASGLIHESVHERWKAGDPAVLSSVAELAAIADEGRAALESGATDELRRLIDRNFDVRALLYDIRPRDQRMIEIGRERGAATKFCGSGGSVLAVPPETSDVEPLRLAYRAEGFRALVPNIASRT